MKLHKLLPKKLSFKYISEVMLQDQVTPKGDPSKSRTIKQCRHVSSIFSNRQIMGVIQIAGDILTEVLFKQHVMKTEARAWARIQPVF